MVDNRDKTLKNRLSIDQNFYEKKYSMGSFRSPSIMDCKLVKALISKYSIKKKISLLDVGCGDGIYSHLFSMCGINVVALDFSSEGVKKAKKIYGNEIAWMVADGLNLPFKRKFDIIFCSGFSPLNLVDDLSDAENIGKDLFEYLRYNGYFIFQWASDLSNTRSEGNLMNYDLKQIKKYFLSLGYGEIIGLFATNKQLFPILGKYALSTLITKICVILQKIHRKNVRIICVVKKRGNGKLSQREGFKQ